MEPRVLKQIADLQVQNPPRFPAVRDREVWDSRKNGFITRRRTDRQVVAFLRQIVRAWKGAEVTVENNRLVLRQKRAVMKLWLIAGEIPEVKNDD